mgnify:CR=1 FL=1
MPLTPADVHNVAFSKPPIGKRGYNEDEVDQFLDLVEDALAQLQDENDELRARVEEQGAGVAAPAASSSSSADEAAIRREVEQKIRADYEAQLRSAKEAKEKAEAEAKSAKDDAAKARKQAEEARAQADKRPAEGVSKPVNAVSQPAEPSQDSHLQAAKVLGLAMAGDDLVNCVKQAREFGLTRGSGAMKLAAVIGSVTGVLAAGMDTMQGMFISETFYWDQDERTRAFTKRVQGKLPAGVFPNYVHAGNYSGVLHYLKAVKELGVGAAKNSGRAAVAASEPRALGRDESPRTTTHASRPATLDAGDDERREPVPLGGHVAGPGVHSDGECARDGA